jgi:hypothetical protein
MEIEQKNSKAIMTKDVVDALIKTTMDLPQADCPVAHYFGPGTYIRQVTFPEGIFAVGHKQRFEQMNIFVAGRVAMVQPDGSLKELRAPMIFNGGPGQKMGIILETVTWLNVYPNPDDCRDIDILEGRYIDKEGPWTEADHSEDRSEDQADYEKISAEVDKLFDDMEYVDLPDAYASVITVRQSQIHGKGIFASWPWPGDTIISPMTIESKPTILKKYLNHSADPNAKIIQTPNNELILMATRDIAGCRGGDQGEEITIDYRNLYEVQS